MNAKQQLEESAQQWCEVPLSKLCRPPYEDWKIAALKRVQREGGAMYAVPFLRHLFGLQQAGAYKLSRPTPVPQ